MAEMLGYPCFIGSREQAYHYNGGRVELTD